MLINVLVYFQIIEALHDPERKDAMVTELLKNALKIEDEKGEINEIISVGGLYLDPKFFTLQACTLKMTKTMPLRHDDVIVATCPKTGTVSPL